jgi:thiamine pyrophosphate-dependent acetolactate synthase large subunit-like protein
MVLVPCALAAKRATITGRGGSMLFQDAFAKALADNDVRTMFGVLGDGNLWLVDSFDRVVGGRYVSFCHEAGAVLAAEGYARASGDLGVATVTHGPGLTNTITALVDGVRARTPIVVVAGDTASSERDSFQNIAQREVVLASGAGFEQLRTPSSLAEDLATAVRRARLERRPVVLNVPADFQGTDVEYTAPERQQVTLQAVRPDPEVIDRAVGIIASVHRPVVLAGAGARTHEAREALLRLAARIGAPVATTLQGKDLFLDYQFNLGICGTLSNPVALETINRCDCVIAFGAGLNRWTTAEGSLLEKKQVIHVDTDAQSINRWVTPDVGIVGDVVAVADTIVEWLEELEHAPSGFASAELATQIAEFDDGDFVDRSTDTTVDIRAALKRIDGIFPAERTLVVDGGRFNLDCFTMLHVPRPNAYVHIINFASIGLGVGNAIGGWFAAPERPVLLVCGDGGFMLGGLTEFSTAVRHKVDLVVVVMNDSAYGAEYVHLRNRKMDPAITMFDWPDLSAVATALGGEGFTVRNLAELDVALRAVAVRNRPVLIDIRVDPDNVGGADGHR